MSSAGSERVVDDLRRVIEDAEALLRESAGLAGERADDLRERAADSVRAARERLAALEHEVMGRARDAVHDADRYVRHNPWQAVGIAAGVGLVIGVLLARR